MSFHHEFKKDPHRVKKGVLNHTLELTFTYSLTQVEKTSAWAQGVVSKVFGKKKTAPVKKRKKLDNKYMLEGRGDLNWREKYSADAYRKAGETAFDVLDRHLKVSHQVIFQPSS